MIKRLFLIVIMYLLAFDLCCNFLIVKANDYLLVDDLNDSIVDIYSVYKDDFSLLFQKDIIEIGDGYLSPDNKYYEIVYVDHDTKMGIAKFVRDISLPKVDVSYAPKPISINDRRICLYMTHNDESYLPSDGVDSVYGNGGIKDVAESFKKELEKYFIDVYFDDTLHIPHDSGAYSRSRVTAESMQKKYNPDAIFDIHRDATSRKFYTANVNGEERCKIRIVIGKSNPNKALNEEFALYVVAVANELYPWLITDIYYGGGHYNQSLDGKALLFEMGTYLMEKEKVLQSTKELAEVVTTALYNTTVNKDSGDLTINGVEDEENVLINEVIDERETSDLKIVVIIFSVVILLSVSVYAIYMFVKNLMKSYVKIDKK